MARVDPEELRNACTSIAEGMGPSPASAAALVDHLVDADLKEYGTHGVRTLPIYQGFADERVPRPRRDTDGRGDGAGCSRVDGDRGIGQLAGLEALEYGVALSGDGIALVVVGNTTLLGRIGAYGEQVAAAISATALDELAALADPVGAGDAVPADWGTDHPTSKA